MFQNLSLPNKVEIETLSTDQVIKAINSQIKKRKSDNLTVDISFLSVLDACRVSMICSTQHYIQHPEGKINWIINNSDVENYTKSLNIGNSEFVLRK